MTPPTFLRSKSTFQSTESGPWGAVQSASHQLRSPFSDLIFRTLPLALLWPHWPHRLPQGSCSILPGIPFPQRASRLTPAQVSSCQEGLPSLPHVTLLPSLSASCGHHPPLLEVRQETLLQPIYKWFLNALISLPTRADFDLGLRAMNPSAYSQWPLQQSAFVIEQVEINMEELYSRRIF